MYATHVLLPVTCLLRRLDAVKVIGAALMAEGRRARTSPDRGGAGPADTTVRGWLRRFAASTEALRGRLHPPRAGAGAGAGLLPRRFGPRSPWWLAAAATGGRLLAPDAISGELILFGTARNTTSPCGDPLNPRACGGTHVVEDKEAGRGRDRTRKAVI